MRFVFYFLPSIFISCQQGELVMQEPVLIQADGVSSSKTIHEKKGSPLILSEEIEREKKSSLDENKEELVTIENIGQLSRVGAEKKSHPQRTTKETYSQRKTSPPPQKREKKEIATAPKSEEKNKKENKILSKAKTKDTSPLQSILDGVEHTYTKINSLDVDFEQTIHNDVLEQDLVQTGSMHIMKPNLFLWDIQFPMEQQYYYNGAQLRVWNPMNQQLLVSEQQQAQGNVTSILHDLSTISQKYRVELVSHTSSTIRLMAYPHMDTGCESLFLTMNAKSYYLNELTSKCSQTGDVHISFSEPRINTRSSSAIFYWTPPEGAEVISSLELLD